VDKKFQQIKVEQRGFFVAHRQGFNAVF